METLQIGIATEQFPLDRLNLQPWRYLCDLALALHRQGHEVRFLTNTRDARDYSGIPLVHHPESRDFEDGRGLQRLLTAAKTDIGIFRMTAQLFLSMRRPPDAGHRSAVGIFLRPLYRGPDLRRRFLDPVLLPEIRWDLHHAALYLSRQLGVWKHSIRYVDRYVTLWRADRDTAVAGGLPAAACTTVPHPFNPFFLEPVGGDLAPPLDALPPSRRRVVFAGPPEASRGAFDVLRLVKAFPPEAPTQVLALLRDPVPQKVEVSVTRRGPHTLAVVRGLVPRSLIRAAYRASQCAVFPYRWVRTSFPLVVSEAVAAGLPVVTCRVHPIRELADRTGLIFSEPGDLKGLARAVTSALDGIDQEESARRNRAWIASTPDWDAVARGVLSGVGG